MTSGVIPELNVILVHIERVGRWLAHRPPKVQARVARELVVRCRSLSRTINQPRS